MQGVAILDRELLDAESLVPAGSVYAFLAEVAGCCSRTAFSPTFMSANERPSVPADVVGSAIVLQSVQGLSDREASRRCAAICGKRWRAGWR
jgi:hypothetical protein